MRDGKGHFARGNKVRRGTKNPKAGRKTNKERELLKTAEQLARQKLEAKTGKVMDYYLKLATGQKVKRGSSPATVRHAVDKILPPVQKVAHSGNIIFETNVPEEVD